MSLKKEPSGRRSVQVETEVPGTPEQVWEAIATGPGVSSWFVPSEFREDGTIVSRFGPGIEVAAKITDWDPPHRFAAESPGSSPTAPPMATEWTVEARDGETCLVRVVHSLFADTDDWDSQLEGTESGWPTFFRTLGFYLKYFRGLPCSSFFVRGVAAGLPGPAWDALMKHWQEKPPVPLHGVTEFDAANLLFVRLDAPVPGIACIFAYPTGERVILTVGFYLYGDTAAATAAAWQPLWQAWMTERLL